MNDLAHAVENEMIENRSQRLPRKEGYKYVFHLPNVDE